MILMIIRLKRSRRGLIARRRWRRNVEVGSIRRARRENKVLLLKGSRWWGRQHVRRIVRGRDVCFVFRGDLMREIARMALRKFRDSIGILGRVVGIR